MSEIYNRTKLYSGSTNVSSCSLTEPVTNFKLVEVEMGGNMYMFEPRSSTTTQKMERWGYYSTEHYLDFQMCTTISNSGKTMSISNFQLFYQMGTESSPRLFGSATNRAGNLKCIKSVWGLNRVSGTPTSATGVPLTGGGWRQYDETLLASAINSYTLNLSEPATAFERIRLMVGRNNESWNCYECASPSGDGSGAFVTPRSYWGNSTATNSIAFTRYAWLSGSTVLSSVSGKSFKLGWGASTAWGGTGSTAKELWRCAPVYAVYGINRK